MKEIVIIGGGSSGLVAGVHLSKLIKENYLDAKVTILEKKDSLGKKLLATGNGRCNMSNLDMSIDHYHGHHKELIESLIHQFDVASFFEDIGLWTKYMNNLLYPQSEQASSVVNALVNQLEKNNVNICINETVMTIKKNQRFKIITQNKQYNADYVIVSTGGDASSQLGSDGSGFKMLHELNHKIYETTPSLVQIKCSNMDKSLKGVRIHGTFTIYADNNVIRKEKGEILFTEDGLSGISVLQLSRYYYLYKNQKVEIGIDALDNYDQKELLAKLKQLIKINPTHPLQGVVNQKYAKFLERFIKDDYSYKSLEKIVELLKDFRFEVIGTRDKNSAQVCSGGASLEMFNADTFESKIIPNLFSVGEVLDIDGDCGGYNLHFAFASGYKASETIFEKLLMEEV